MPQFFVNNAAACRTSLSIANGAPAPDRLGAIPWVRSAGRRPLHPRFIASTAPKFFTRRTLAGSTWLVAAACLILARSGWSARPCIWSAGPPGSRCRLLRNASEVGHWLMVAALASPHDGPQLPEQGVVLAPRFLLAQRP